MNVIIDHLTGKHRGKRQTFDIPEAGRIRFGRHPDNEVAFDAHADLDASTWHAELRQDRSRWVLLDVGSSNGTFVSGQQVTRLPIGERHAVEVEFGSGGPRCRMMLGSEDQVSDTTKTTPTPPPETIAPARGGIGAATVARMMREAVDEAQERASRRSTRKFGFLMAVVVIVFGVAIAVILIRDTRTRSDADQKLASMRAEVERDRQIKQQVHNEWDSEPGLQITATNALAVFLIAYTDTASGTDRALCTAFAVRPKYLATNAHCVEAMQKLDNAKQPLFAVRNRTPKRYALTGWTKDPRFKGEGTLSVDVGLVEVDGTLEQTVNLASRERALALGEGTKIFLYGFPAAVADPRAPVASLLDGIIGRVTTFAGEREPANDLLVQHNAMTSPGASGSPIFDVSGQVIAINVGQVLGDEHIVAPGVNVSIRIDGLFPLLQTKEAMGTRP